MNTLILGIILSVVSFVALIIFNKMDCEWCVFFSAMLMGVSIGLVISVLLLSAFGIPPRIDLFEKQKAHFETLASDTLENTGAIIVKTEQNEWLFKVQYQRERFGNWSIYPASVLELEPIE